MSDNNTLDYYNQHTADFVNTTQNVDFHEIQERMRLIIVMAL